MGASPQSAANMIRSKVDMNAAAKLTPEQQHKVLFMTEVCRLVGLEPNAINLTHVSDLIEKEGIQPEGGAEYPKHVPNYAGVVVEVSNKAEEDAALVAPPEPEPAAPAEVETPADDSPVTDHGSDRSRTYPKSRK